MTISCFFSPSIGLFKESLEYRKSGWSLVDLGGAWSHRFSALGRRPCWAPSRCSVGREIQRNMAKEPSANWTTASVIHKKTPLLVENPHHWPFVSASLG